VNAGPSDVSANQDSNSLVISVYLKIHCH